MALTLVRQGGCALGMHKLIQRKLSTGSVATMAAIKALRGRTGAPIKAVKDALEAENGDQKRALEYLRKLGAALAANRAHRNANDGVVSIAISPDGRSGAAIELCSETDFVARTPQFTALAATFARNALGVNSANSPQGVARNLPIDQLLSIDKGEDKLAEATTALGEKIELRRVITLTAGDESNGLVFGYLHRNVGEGCGKIGVLVALKGNENNLSSAGRRVAMHVAAASPKFARIKGVGGVPQDVLSKEREILFEAARAEMIAADKPKPDSVLQKVVDGRIRKWFSETVLEEQEMLVEVEGFNGKPRSVLKSLQEESNGALISDYVRLEVGGD